MLCGKCKKPLLCKCCGETECSSNVDDGPYVCICKTFRPDECQECSKIKEYVGKDAMWYIRSTIEAVMLLIGTVCFSGFVAGMLFVIIAIPMVWNKPLDYQPFPWLNQVMAWSICVGLVDMLFMVSIDGSWREDYEDHSSVRNIRET